jgi:hypothetical protein
VDEVDWLEITRRNARSVQTTIGWIYWDPGAVARYEALGFPGPLGYIASRSAPLARAGPDAVIAAFGSISPFGIRMAFAIAEEKGITFDDAWRARDEAVPEGLRSYAPGILEPLAAVGPTLWPIVDRLPSVGRTFFGAHLRMPRPTDLVLSGWHAVNCLREWRGDTHWAIVAAAGLTGVEVSILHNAWLRYEEEWLPKSRGTTEEELAEAWASLQSRGLANGHEVTVEGVALRQRIEDDTDRLTTRPWELLGADAARLFAEDFEPPCELLLKRVDDTAGPNYQPASRLREPHAPSVLRPPPAN